MQLMNTMGMGGMGGLGGMGSFAGPAPVADPATTYATQIQQLQVGVLQRGVLGVGGVMRDRLCFAMTTLCVYVFVKHKVLLPRGVVTRIPCLCASCRTWASSTRSQTSGHSRPLAATSMQLSTACSKTCDCSSYPVLCLVDSSLC